MPALFLLSVIALGFSSAAGAITTLLELIKSIFPEFVFATTAT